MRQVRGTVKSAWRRVAFVSGSPPPSQIGPDLAKTHPVSPGGAPATPAPAGPGRGEGNRLLSCLLFSAVPAGRPERKGNLISHFPLPRRLTHLRFTAHKSAQSQTERLFPELRSSVYLDWRPHRSPSLRRKRGPGAGGSVLIPFVCPDLGGPGMNRAHLQFPL